ncbi:MAG: hypothetical protein KF894_01635 [Labilithrix sp.]|nr:hypothetical protein [Labilithrix sp.]
MTPILSSSRFALLAAAAGFATVAALAACSTDSSPDADDAGNPTRDRDSGANVDDEKDSGPAEEPDDAGTDADVKGGEGTECAFNRECQAALRCECDEATGCFCKPGPRGTGKVGVDTCTSGNDCESSICIDGPTDDEMICSDECQDETECGGKLPRCIAIVGIPEPICVREPPQ